MAQLLPPNRTLLLVRHGDYALGRLESDGHLNARGIEKSRSTASAIEDLPGLPPIRQIVSSDWRRAMETADIICRHLNITVNTINYLLNEGNIDTTLHEDHFKRAFHSYCEYCQPASAWAVSGPHSYSCLSCQHNPVLHYPVSHAVYTLVIFYTLQVL